MPPTHTFPEVWNKELMVCQLLSYCPWAPNPRVFCCDAGMGLYRFPLSSISCPPLGGAEYWRGLEAGGREEVCCFLLLFTLQYQALSPAIAAAPVSASFSNPRTSPRVPSQRYPLRGTSSEVQTLAPQGHSSSWDASNSQAVPSTRRLDPNSVGPLLGTSRFWSLTYSLCSPKPRSGAASCR